MNLKQIRKMNCGCSLTDGAITMCPMHEAGPKLWKAAERLLQAHYEADAKAAKDPNREAKYEEAMEMGNKYMPTLGLMGALVKIEEILGDGEEAVADEVPDENPNHQPKLS